ncbi:structural maintenance of chromosomes protein 1A [Neodiprion pinetum]|uniref:Structural maintenance of chromosomes protein n=1 Tax=Neodiprion lecontei TaxID=441921 RepID=A0ABM3G5Y3_NEOLC|nr:structural maintenance of chromosomes protein 1A [Neodiprion fabricii]XP_046433124.1 structural maintenance of chromosomes protein 1A [Neodiprion fabricii]XP_046479209.1 structural maintenance of chromosomes protein 1A [Neodiprion pinetum]XP_046479219.1 structural maintenance of chromosomes protein 1A [Neodiprion pinetum]XP_046595674.1 structural maintenance of chromosomes protein 1A [Neodiprion lecontei]XP_046595677.1 structural maintenance of chromosomes protein 1A [Neodiprion lecontei]X
MPAFLSYIEVEDFKSYKGKLRIGPLKPFTAVVGPNGSGKSNFMDAISFVMGEKTSSLRVKRFSELIHGASIGQPVKRSASVTAVFKMEDGTEKSFMRSVQGSASEHRIDNMVVTSQVYLNELEHLGINVKAKNFLVFQGAVESIAMKNPKERTALFEEISNSGALKTEYERLRSEMFRAEEETQFSYQKKKGVAAERKEAKLEKEEAEKYHRLKEECAEKQVELQLFRLFHNEKEIENLENTLKKKQHEVDKILKKKEKVDEKLREQKKEAGKLNREYQKIEQDIREMEAEISKKRPTFIKAKERVTHMQKKVESARKSLATARTADEAHKKDIKELHDQLSQVEQAKSAYEANVAGQSQSQGRDVQLEDEQVREYNNLKEAAGKQSARYLQMLDSINRQQKSDQDRLDNEGRKKTDVENKHKQKGHMRDEAQKRVEKLEEHIRTSEAALEDQKKLRADLQSDVGTSKDKIQQIQRELENISEQLGDAKVDKHEVSRNKKKTEIVENFKRLYPGVYDRMINMCQPIHKRFNVAITKVLGKYMEAIVVDTEKTARQCIQYLKEQYLEPETFLPLDYIQAKPLKGRLRNIQEPKNVKLLYDVLAFSPKDIDRAVLFATNNALVCETPEDANKVAYEMDKKTRYDCVALDGTYYQKAGIISGGSLDLAKKAKRWDEKQMSQLKSRKEKLTEELREALKKSRKESELNTVDSQIRGLETRLKYNKNDLVTTKKQIADLEVELQALQNELNLFGPTISDIEKTMATRDQEIQAIKEKMNSVEDDVFANFCEQIGVANIRQYEERELRSQQERAKKRMEFDNQTNRILNQLDFEKQKDTESNVLRWERMVQDAEDKLDAARQTESHQLTEKENDEVQMKKLTSTRINKKLEMDQEEEEIGKARREAGAIAKEVQAAQKQLNSIESKIEQRKADRHAILMQCKMEDIAIPMLRGNMEDITQESTVAGSETGTDSTLNTQQQYERESLITIDYGLLPDSLKDIDDDDIKKTNDKLNRVINELQGTIQRIQAPNMKALQKLYAAKEKLQETNEEFEQSRKKAKKAKTQFEKVKKERHDRFMACFEHVANEIDPIYKSLAKNQSAQAFLGPENPEEPYLDGINYNCVAPGKRFQPMSNLSGGEKTVAALALLFAVHSFQPAPFFVLDEIDAALDNTNIGKVASYIRDKTSSLQTIVISLKEEFYSHADALVGICPDVGECLESKVLTLDLTEYPTNSQAVEREPAGIFPPAPIMNL